MAAYAYNPAILGRLKEDGEFEACLYYSKFKPDVENVTWS